MLIGDLVRDSCRRLLDRAILVSLDGEALDRFAADHGAELIAAGRAAGAVGADARSVEARVATVLILDAVNFGSGYHDGLDKDPGSSGASTIAGRLSRHLTRIGDPSWQDLTAVTAPRLAEILGQPGSTVEQRALMELFATALVDLGRFVADRGDGSFAAIVEEADGSAQNLARALLAMPFYRDRTDVDGETVHFYKRAQITAADLARQLPDWPPAAFDDLDRLTAFADNLVPHVLRVDGVLGYDPELARTIDRRHRLPAGSRAEVEIRAAGVVAVERLVEALARAGHRVRAMDVDLALWLRGGRRRYKAIPRHRSRSVYY